MRNRLLILACSLAVVLSGNSFTLAAGGPPAVAGKFSVIVQGHWAGNGKAVVAGSLVNIIATVRDDDGNVGTLVVANAVVKAGHFAGAGTLFGLPVRIEGRVDAADPPRGKGKGKGKGQGNGEDDGKSGGPVLTDARITATFSAGGHVGRIAGSKAP